MAGKSVPDDKQLFICMQCSQPYWWNASETSRSSRALSLADRLFVYIQEGLGRPVNGLVKRDSSGNLLQDSFQMSSIVDVDGDKDEQMFFRVREPPLDDDLINFISVHAMKYCREPLFTNLNDGFKG